MPAGSKPGERRGGRPPGAPNKSTIDIQAKLAAVGCDPILGMALIASGEVPCGTCHGKGKTKYKSEGIIRERVCESCYGTLKEKITPDLRGKMYAELAQYVAPKRKAIEHSLGEGAGEALVAVLTARRNRLASKDQQ